MSEAIPIIKGEMRLSSEVIREGCRQDDFDAMTDKLRLLRVS